MPEARLERTRESYRCHRSMVLVPWAHCDCSGCNFARLMLSRMRAGLAPSGQTREEFYKESRDWFDDAEVAR